MGSLSSQRAGVPGPRGRPPSTSQACATPCGAFLGGGAQPGTVQLHSVAAGSVWPARVGADAPSALVSAMGSLSEALSCPTAASLDTPRGGPAARPDGWALGQVWLGQWPLAPALRASGVCLGPAGRPRPQTRRWAPGGPCTGTSSHLGAWGSCGSSGRCRVGPWTSLAEREPSRRADGGSRRLRQLRPHAAAGGSGERRPRRTGPRQERKTRPLPADSSTRTPVGQAAPGLSPPDAREGGLGVPPAPTPSPRAQGGQLAAVSHALPEPRPAQVPQGPAQCVSGQVRGPRPRSLAYEGLVSSCWPPQANSPSPWVRALQAGPGRGGWGHAWGAGWLGRCWSRALISPNSPSPS